MNGTVARPRFIAYVVSSVTGRTYVLDAILAWNTAKGDSGDAGTWSITMPLYNPYVGGSPPNFETIAYASVASPMDLVAIYACQYNGQSNAPSLGPNSASGLVYGQLATITGLYSETCVMIGMVDSFSESPVDMTDEPQPTFEVSGRDLTKIFYVNDSLVPQAAGLASASRTVALNPLTLAVSKNYSGTKLLLKVLDLAMTKAPPGTAFPAATQAALAPFTYPWREFIDTSLLDPNYQHLQDAVYPPYQFQGGSVWANVVELRNAPTCRLFVNEFGQLIFDDAYMAWTGNVSPGSGTGSGNPTAYATGSTYTQMQKSDIKKFRVDTSDESLITYLQVRPVASLVAKLAQSTVTGDGSALGFAQGIARPSVAGGNAINIFGYRQGDFQSYWDVSSASAKGKIVVLSLLYNSLEKATLVVKGNTLATVGDRLTVPVTTSRANTTNATWYVESVIHSGIMGEDWTTTYGLRFPNGGF